MANTTTSPNMLLPVPIVGSDPGPQYATDVNSCLTLVDQHNHSPGSGVQITPAGLDINSDLSIGGNNLTTLRSARFEAQGSPLSGASDLGCCYVSGVDLYYNDELGNQVRITQSGGVAGTPGSISNLTPPASASYVSADQTFVWQSSTNTPANLDAGSVIFRNISANSDGVTVSAPSALASNYTLTLPTLPGSTLPLSLSASGIMSASQITLAQLVSSVQQALVPSGSILAYGGTSAPSGFLMCDGTAVSRTTYSGLFSAISTAYGTGDGSTTFNVPDLRGLFIRGVDNGAGNDPDTLSRVAVNGGNSGDNVGSYQPDTFAAHSHSINIYGPASGSTGVTSAGNPADPFGTSATNNAGGDETRPKNLYANYIIKV